MIPPMDKAVQDLLETYALICLGTSLVLNIVFYLIMLA